METFVSFAIETRSSDVHNIMATCALLHVNFFGMCLNIATFWIITHNADTAVLVQDHNLVCIERLS